MILPKMVRVKSIVHDTSDTFTLLLEGKERFLPGQFNMLYLFKYGEVPISICNDPEEELRHTIRAVGAVTRAMQKLKEGDEIGIRGPFGSHWPLEKKGGHVLLIAGGLGFAALRSALFYLAAHRGQYKSVTLLYGARTPEDLIYKEEMEQWKKSGIDVQVSVDHADETWCGQVGVVTGMIHKHAAAPKETLVFLCGPEIMVHFALNELERSGIPENAIYISMERNMECALGFCGHCQYGPYFLCKDGPVFSYEQLKKWLTIKEL